MFGKSALCASALTAISGVCAMPAHATTMVVTVNGVVSSSSGNIGEFGSKLENALVGHTATFRMSIDLDNPLTEPVNITDDHGYATPYGLLPVSAELSIDDHIVNIQPNHSFLAYSFFEEGSFDGVNTLVVGEAESFKILSDLQYDINFQFFVSGDGYATGGVGFDPFPEMILHSGEYYPKPGNINHAYFWDKVSDSSTSETQATYLSFDVTSVAVDVPEPATWALMLAGFGLAGGALRRRRAMVAV